MHTLLIYTLVMVIFLVTPFVLTAVTFIIYTHVHGDDPDNQLTAVRAFMTLALYNLLQVPLGFLPMVINFLSAVCFVQLLIQKSVYHLQATLLSSTF